MINSVNSSTRWKWGLFALVAGLVLISTRAAFAANTSYYIDCSAGSNGTGTQASPWNNLTTVNNHAPFGAGDKLYLKRGTTCNGMLYPKGSGVSGNPLVIDAYGTGNKPIIAAAGQTEQAVYLFNQQYVEIRNLEITNQGAAPVNNRWGVRIRLDNFGTGNYYRLINLTVHHVNGTAAKGGGNMSAGIYFEVGPANPTVQTKFNDILIDGAYVYTTDRVGILFSSTWYNRPEINDNCPTCGNYYASTNVVVRNSETNDTGGDGMIPQMMDGALFEYNIAHDFNLRGNSASAGIWAWNADHITFQFNEFYHGGWTGNLKDSQGMDFDGGNIGNIYQYNYSHENKGGFLLICGWGTTRDNIFRYNVSQNDGNHTFHVGCDVSTNTQIYNNTIYAAAPVQTPNKVVHVDNSWFPTNLGQGAFFYNNIFYAPSGAGNSYSFPAGQQSVFDYNLFYGAQLPAGVSDPHALTSDPLFVNPGTGGNGLAGANGYKIQSSSPAIGSGKVIASNGGKDYWGNTIPSGCSPDRGAHQFTTSCGGGGPTSTPTPTNTPGGGGSGNLLSNPGFETGAMSPWAAWTSSVVTGNARTGTYSMRIGTGEGSGEQTVTGLLPNTTYVLSGWIKTSATSVTGNIGAKNFGGTQIFASSTNTAYTQLQVTFTTGAANTSALVYCYKPTTTGYVYCDDMSLTVSGGTGPTATPTPTPTPTLTPTPPPQTNLVQNPGLETGAMSPWTAWTSSVVTGNAHSGTYSMRIGTGEGSGEQVITGLLANTTYILSGWVKTSATSVQVNIGAKNFGGTQVFASSTSTTYTQRSVTFTTGASNTSVTIYCYKPTTTGYAYCDDFSLTKQ